jgi:hypothetical protein
MALEMDLPYQNHYVPRRINNRYINTLIWVSFLDHAGGKRGGGGILLYGALCHASVMSPILLFQLGFEVCVVVYTVLIREWGTNSKDGRIVCMYSTYTVQ